MQQETQEMIAPVRSAYKDMSPSARAAYVGSHTSVRKAAASRANGLKGGAHTEDETTRERKRIAQQARRRREKQGTA